MKNLTDVNLFNPASSLPSMVKDLNWNSAMSVIFYNSITSLCSNLYDIHTKQNCIYPFVIESLYEYILRFNENGEIELDTDTFQKLCDIIFRNPEIVLKRNGTDNLMTLFSLWQTEDRHYIFATLYRYNWFFTFKNDKVDMLKAFEEKFGCKYESFLIFAVINITAYIALRTCESVERMDYTNIIQKTMITFKCVTNNLTTNRAEYLKLSNIVCKKPEDLVYSLKISKLYPFLEEGENVACFMPHVIIPACSTSLLYRLMDENNSLYSLFTKEVLEEYYFDLAKTQHNYSFISRELEYSGKKTPDLILVEKCNVYFIEEKSFSPNCKTRLMKKTSINQQVDEIIDGLEQLYRFLFIKYPKGISEISNFDLNNRFGILSLREDASFDRRILYNGLFERQRITEQVEKDLIIKHIKISNLSEFEVGCSALRTQAAWCSA